MSSIVYSTWNFMKRHRGKLILAGGAVGGYVMLNRYLSAWEKAWQKSSSRDFISEVKKKEIHFENTIETCNSTCVSLSGKIIDILDATLDPEPILSQIKSSPDKKVLLFQDLKIRIFTRIISEVYCLVLFVVYLRVQLSILAGYIYVNSSQQNGLPNGSSSASSSVQHKYLSLLHTFYQDGINQIIEPVQAAVEHAMKDISLKEKISLKEIKNIFEKVKTSMDFTLSSSNSNVSTFLLNPEKIFNASSNQGDQISMKNQSSNSLESIPSSSIPIQSSTSSSSSSNKDNELLQKLLNETQDILESDDLKKVLDAGIDIGFSIVMDLLLGCFVRLADEFEKTNNGFRNPHNIQIPLAKLLPSIRQTIFDRKPEDRLVMVRHLICLDVLNCFAANIYEAFCHSNDED